MFMKNDRGESDAMVISLSLSLGILLAVIVVNFTLLKKPAFYIDLRQYPIYGREGGALTQEALTAPPWKIIAPAGNQELVIVKAKDIPALLSALPAFYRHLRSVTDRIRAALG